MGELLGFQRQRLVVAARNDPLIIRERAVDQLGGQLHAVEGELDLGVRQRNLDGAIGIVEQAAQLRHGLARYDDAGHVGCTVGQVELEARQPVAVRCRGAQNLRLAFLDRVQVDAHQVEARLVARHRKRRLADQTLEVVGREAEAVGQGAGRHLREVFLGQASEFETHRAGGDREASAFAGQQFSLHLRPVGQLAHDVVQHVRRRGGRAVAQDIGGNGFDDFDIEISGRQLQRALAGFDQDVRQNRDRVAALDDTLDVAQRLQQGAPFDVDFHRSRKRGLGRLKTPGPVIPSCLVTV